MILLILAWLASGFAGCKVIGLSNEYLAYFSGTATVLICGGMITLVAATIIRLKGDKSDDCYETR